MEDTMEQLIRQVQATQKRLRALLEARTDDQDWQPAPGEWSFRYIAAHLATTEKECYQDRVVRIAAGGNPRFESYFNTDRDFSQFDLKDSLQAWTVTRQEIIDLVHSLPEEKRSLTGTHAAFGTLNVQGVVKLMLDHDQEHIQDLEKMMGRYGSKVPAR